MESSGSSISRESSLLTEVVLGLCLTRLTLMKTRELTLCKPPLDTATLCWGVRRSEGLRRRPKTSREGSAAYQGPWHRWRAADFVFKETRLHCASQAQPRESRL